LASDGPLAQGLPGFAPRDGQLTMAGAVADAIERRSHLLVEAGTGTGKTYAYLVPALLSGQRVVVSTGTRNLQDQLFARDLPALTRAMGAPVEVALLKGRANYLCVHRLDLAREDPAELTRTGLRELARIVSWSETTRTGDVAEVTGVPEDSMTWSRVTSTTDNCLGSACPQWQDCHLVRARRDGLFETINHHLLMADLALKEEGFGDLLPAADAVIVDEAHQLADVATRFFGTTVGSRQVRQLTGDLRAESLQAGAWDSGLESDVRRLEKALDDARLAMGEGTGRRAWPDPGGEPERALEVVADEAIALAGRLEPLEGLTAGLDGIRRRVEQLVERMSRLTGPMDHDHVRWVETWPRSFALQSAPVDAGPMLAASMNERPAAWIFTSATLAVGDDFSLLQGRLGLHDADVLSVGSPFDYAARSRLHAPPGLPEPASREFTHRALAAAAPLLEASAGGAFFLFTSHRALREAADWFRSRFGDERFPLLVQGTEPRDVLLRRFRDSGSAVLLGTGSFWEGVDVRGPALRLVVIDRLPFAVPDDPVLEARLARAREEGGNPFRDIQLPEAALALKQGVGRLMRDVGDRGVVVISDPRLISKSYGRVFLGALPPMPLERDPAVVAAFLAAVQPPGAVA
jgi:ATP-dependent DNA helicase DinG